MTESNPEIHQSRKFHKKTIYTFAAILLITIAYFIATGSLPSFNLEKRYRDFTKVYFRKNSDIFIKEVDMGGTGFKCFVAFEKSTYFKKLFMSPKSVEQVESHVDDTFKALKLNEGKKLIIFKPLDLGMFNPFIQLFIPLTRVYQIEIQDNGTNNPFQIYNVENIDIDGDGKQELVVHWLAYGGGSGGGFVSAVITENEGNFKIADFFPVPQPVTAKDIREEEELLENKSNFGSDKEFITSQESLSKIKKLVSENMSEYKKEGYLLNIENDEYIFKVDGIKTKYSLSSYHTDNYFNFVPLPDNKGYRLVSAQSFHDEFGHYSPQSWSLTSFRFVGKKFVPDLEFKPIKIDKKRGWSITDVHGYTMSSHFGIISYMLLPPWLEMQDRDNAIMKTKVESVVTNYFSKHFQKQ